MLPDVIVDKQPWMEKTRGGIYLTRLTGDGHSKMSSNDISSRLCRNRLWEDLLILPELGRVDFFWVDSEMLTAKGRLLLQHSCHFIVSMWKWLVQSGKCNFSHMSVFRQVLYFTEVIYYFTVYFLLYHRREKIHKYIEKRMILRFSRK